MNKSTAFVIAVLCCIVFKGHAQGKADEFQPYGKPFMKVFSNYHSTFSDNETTSAFELTRVYLGYEYFFSKNLSAKANIDVADPGVGKLQMTAYVKNAYLKYSEKQFNVQFGMIPTTQYKYQEDFWGYRYVAKVAQDEYGFAASADLGVSADYRLAKQLSVDLAVTNGEGYKSLQTDDYMKTALGVTFTPVKKLAFRGLYDWMGGAAKQQSWVGFAGYSADRFSLGVEYNFQKNVKMVDGKNLTATSVYTTYKASKKVKLFARYDELSSNTVTGTDLDWNLDKDGRLLMCGFEFTPVKGVCLAPNFQCWNPANGSKPVLSSVFFNCEFKF